MEEITFKVESIQVDGGVLVKVNGERVLIDFPTYNRMEKIKKIVNRMSN